jgi:hypothetical protein
MKELADAEKFRSFVEANRKRVYAKMLRRVQRRYGGSNWAPSGVLSGGALCFAANVDRELRALYRRTTAIRVGAPSCLCRRRLRAGSFPNGAAGC